MSKSLVVVLFGFIFAMLYFLTGEQNNNIDQQLNDLSVKTEEASSNAESQKNHSDENILDEHNSASIKSNSPSSQLEPEIQQALKKMLNTSSQGLIEKQTEKGISVDLKGRFQTVPVATINENGEVEIQDYSSAPNTGK